MLRALRWGLVLLGVGALVLYGVLGGQGGPLALIGLLALSLALNLWLIPLAFRAQAVDPHWRRCPACRAALPAAWESGGSTVQPG